MDKPFKPRTKFLAKAHILYYLSGDTLIADLDIGWGITLKERKVRLANIVCPDPESDEGIESTKFVESLMPIGSVINLTSVENPLRTNRTLGLMYINGEDVSKMMINSGHAVPFRRSEDHRRTTEIVTEYT